MTTQHLIEPGQVVHQAAAILASLEYIDQGAALGAGGRGSGECFHGGVLPGRNRPCDSE